jgi:ABC-type Mn2+/Zn2+ transport system permease subunit
MRALFLRIFIFLFLAFFGAAAAHAQTAGEAGVNPEDAPIADELPVVTPVPRVHTHDPRAAPAPADDYHGEQPQLQATATTADYFQLWKSFSGDDKSFMRHALVAGVLVALMCSYLGVYVVLKRIVFVSVAMSALSSAGIALGLLLGFTPIIGAAILTLLGVVLFSIQWSPRRVPRESYIGVLYSIAAAMGILLIARSAQGEGHMLTLLEGDILTITTAETIQMAIAFALVAVIHTLFNKEFVLVSFDRDQAATLGFRAALWDFLLFLTIGLVIAFSIRAAGVLVTTSMLVLPAVAALLLTNRLRAAWWVAALLAIVPVPLGLHFSLLSRDFPSSALIVALSFGLLLPTLLYSSLKRS